MHTAMQADAYKIIHHAVQAVLPGAAVKNALQTIERKPSYVVAIGKAAWKMAAAAAEVLGDDLIEGIVITKYHHSEGPIRKMTIYEAGHPVPDANGLAATEQALRLADKLQAEDRMIFLVSGGGSALFEALPDGVTLDDLMKLTKKLLSSGASITEMNAIRKHISKVKGGRFALRCMPAKVINVILSDIIGDPLDAIASGPAYPDASTSENALKIVRRYGVEITPEMEKSLAMETPKTLSNITTCVTGNVQLLCESAKEMARGLGYMPVVLTATLDCEAREAGAFFAAIARQIRAKGEPFATPCAVIAGGETVVHLKGSGKGGRNQELALAAAKGMDGLENTLLFSFGSDGTDGPTDAAGGMVDGNFYAACAEKGLSVEDTLENNDAYHLLKEMGGLIVSGPTGTNVNDLTVLLVR